ncbi:major latex protein 146-like [Papaver somniferum]|uniref:major latex protein 146-like n=1 Tax=Papaver somniferum TaxID=3469 RepID=UPI000E701D97|nr:major latex protein 146-like [Papaver somniferum]
MAGAVTGGTGTCLKGTLSFKTEVHCSADKYYSMYKHEVTELPKIMPFVYGDIQVIEGDGVSVGSVKQWNYVLEGKPHCVKEKVTEMDDEKRRITHDLFEGEVMNVYKKFAVTLHVKPKKGDIEGNVVKWSVEYEKLNEDSPTPLSYLDVLDKITRDLNAHLCQ